MSLAGGKRGGKRRPTDAKSRLPFTLATLKGVVGGKRQRRLHHQSLTTSGKRSGKRHAVEGVGNFEAT